MGVITPIPHPRLTPLDVEALAARPGRSMKFYAASFRGLRSHLASTYPDWDDKALDAEAQRQADAYHRVVGAEPARCS